ncbi:MAG TPA: hypothetical protein VKC89_03510 [Patescibacteria group bacterium]|nr:hypothetical protein [Patescibacteria group bacterium]
MKKLIFSVIAITLFSISASVVKAQTPSILAAPSSTQVQSDFAKDLQDGEKDATNDLEAQKNQKDLKDNENVGVNEQGETVNEQQGVNQEDMAEPTEELNEDNGSSSQNEKNGVENNSK